MGKCIVDSTSTCDVRTINLLFHYWLEMEIDLIWFQSLFKQAHWYCDSNIYLLLVAICITLVFGLDLRNPIIVRYPFVFYTKSMACGKNAFQCNLMSKVFWRILERVSKWKTLPKEREIGRQRDRETERRRETECRSITEESIHEIEWLIIFRRNAIDIWEVGKSSS